MIFDVKSIYASKEDKKQNWKTKPAPTHLTKTEKKL
jgi:hypothetical protein